MMNNKNHDIEDDEIDAGNHTNMNMNMNMELQESENIAPPTTINRSTASINTSMNTNTSITRTLFSNANSNANANSDPVKNQSRVLFQTDTDAAASTADGIGMDCYCSQESTETFITDANASFDSTITLPSTTPVKYDIAKTNKASSMSVTNNNHVQINGGRKDGTSSRKRTNSDRTDYSHIHSSIDSNDSVKRTYSNSRILLEPGRSSFDSSSEQGADILTPSSSKQSIIAKVNIDFNVNGNTNDDDDDDDENTPAHAYHGHAESPLQQHRSSEEWLTGAVNGHNAMRGSILTDLQVTGSPIDECKAKFNGHSDDASMKEELEEQNCVKFRRLNISGELNDDSQNTMFQQHQQQEEVEVEEKEVIRLPIRMGIPRTVHKTAALDTTKSHYALNHPFKGFKSPEENGGESAFVKNKIAHPSVDTFISPNDIMDHNVGMHKVPSPPIIDFESDVISPSIPIVRKKQSMVQNYNANDDVDDDDVGDIDTDTHHGSPFAMKTNMNMNMNVNAPSSFYGNYRRYTTTQPETPMLERKPPRRMSFTPNRLSSPSASASAYQSDPLPPKEISRLAEDFDVVGTLGEGSFGTVYKCLSRLDGCTYAIKAAKRRAKGKADRNRMLQEVKALAELSDVSDMAAFHIVRYHQAWIEDDRLHIVTDLCQSTLQMEIGQGIIKRDTQRQYKLLREMLLALKLIHQFGKVHLDIKPDNIFIKDDKFKLGDFGLVVEESTVGEVEEGDCRYMCMDLLSGNHRDLTKVCETIRCMSSLLIAK